MDQQHAAIQYVVEGVCYEFVRVARIGDLWWAGIPMNSAGVPQ